MTTFNLNCQAVEATLADYLDETLEPWVRSAVEEHLAGCGRCSSLAHELGNIARETAALPALLPDDDIWPGVAARIGVPEMSAEAVEESAPLTPMRVEDAQSTPPPFEESEPSAPVLERVVFSSDTFVPMVEQTVAPEEPLMLAPESQQITSDLHPPMNERILTSGPARPPEETPSFAKEPPVQKSEPAEVRQELSSPLTVATEPEVVPRAVPVTTSVPTAATRTQPRRVATNAPAGAVAAPREKRWGLFQIALAAAALVMVSAISSSLLTVRLLRPAGTSSVASTAGAEKAASTEKAPSLEKAASSQQRRSGAELSSSEQLPDGRSIGEQARNGETVAPDLSIPTPAVAPPLPVLAAASPIDTRSPEAVVYDKEINTLSRIVRRKKSQLEPSTVTMIDKNLGAVDSAIAQIRAAIEDDPSNSLLDAQASHALEMKVELLRRAAMMRSITSL